MDLVTLAMAKKYTRDKVAEASIGGVDVAEYVNERVDELIGGASGTFDTLGEIESAIKNKVDKVSGKGLSTNDFTNAYKDKVDSALQSYTETDPTVPAWAKAASKPTYTASDVGAVPTTRTVNGKKLSGNITLTAEDVGALPDTTEIPSIDGLATKSYVDDAIANIILTSEGGKKFKLTVGDDGTITATEVAE